MPAARARSMAGAMTSRSSVPRCPLSPACGLSPHTAMRGRAMPQSRRRSSCEDAQRDVEQRGRDRVADRAQRQVRGGQRHAQRVGRQQHHRVRGAACAAARYSVWPVNGTPASLITLFCTGAVTMAANSPLRRSRRWRGRAGRARGGALAGSSLPATQGAASGTSMHAQAARPMRAPRRRVDSRRARDRGRARRARSASSARLPTITSAAGEIRAVREQDRGPGRCPRVRPR